MTGVLVEAGLVCLATAVVSAQVQALRNERDREPYRPRHRRHA